MRTSVLKAATAVPRTRAVRTRLAVICVLALAASAAVEVCENVASARRGRTGVLCRQVALILRDHIRARACPAIEETARAVRM